MITAMTPAMSVAPFPWQGDPFALQLRSWKPYVIEFDAYRIGTPSFLSIVARRMEGRVSDVLVQQRDDRMKEDMDLAVCLGRANAAADVEQRFDIFGSVAEQVRLVPKEVSPGQLPVLTLRRLVVHDAMAQQPREHCYHLYRSDGHAPHVVSIEESAPDVFREHYKLLQMVDQISRTLDQVWNHRGTSAVSIPLRSVVSTALRLEWSAAKLFSRRPNAMETTFFDGLWEFLRLAESASPKVEVSADGERQKLELDQLALKVFRH